MYEWKLNLAKLKFLVSTQLKNIFLQNFITHNNFAALIKKFKPENCKGNRLAACINISKKLKQNNQNT